MVEQTQEVAATLISKGANVIEINPAVVKQGWRARQDVGDVDGLAESIKRDGQMQPILVRMSKRGDFVIIAGMRRTKACHALGIKVKAIVVDPTDELQVLDLQLAENLHRKNFDILEVGEGLKRRKALYEKAHPETQTGGTGRGRPKEDPALRFTQATAIQFGVAERKVYEMLEIAELPQEEKAEIESAESKDRQTKARQALKKKRDQRKIEKLEQQAQKKEQERADSEALNPDDSKSHGPRIELYEGDQLEILEGVLEPNSIDLILTDPPYGRDRSLINHSERTAIGEDVDWDSLDVGWVLDVVRYLDKDTGQLLIFCPLEAIGRYEEVFRISGVTYRTALVWHKTNPGTVHRDTYLQSLEACVWGVYGRTPHFGVWENSGAKEVHNFKEGPICMGNERLNHPTQKPLWLIADLLEQHSLPGQRVLDPFAGVATTLVACKKAGRHCVGVEQDPNFYSQGKVRLSAT